MSLTNGDNLAFRFPAKFPDCNCTICSRLGISDADNIRLDNIPSVFQLYKLVKVDTYSTAPATAAAPTTATDNTIPVIKPGKIIKYDRDMTAGDYSEFELIHPTTAVLYNDQSNPNQLWVKSCLKLLRSLRKLKAATIFNQPVDLSVIPDYNNYIAHPQDLNTIENKLLTDPIGYQNPDEFISDVRLVFRNAYLYNRQDSIYFAQAKQLSIAFEQGLLAM